MTALSRLRPEFESPWGYKSQKSDVRSRQTAKLGLLRIKKKHRYSFVNVPLLQFVHIDLAGWMNKQEKCLGS